MVDVDDVRELRERDENHVLYPHYILETDDRVGTRILSSVGGLLEP